MGPRKKTVNKTKSGSESSIEEDLSTLADTNKRLKRKIFDLYTIFEISVHLNSMLDSERLLDGLLLTCIGQMGVSGAALLLAPDEFRREQKTNRMASNFRLDLECTKGISIKEDQFSFYPNRRLYHLMQSSKRPLFFNEVSHALEIKQSEIKKLKDLEAALIIPMILKKQIRGILILTNKISGAEFNDADLEFLSILVNQLTVAVENSRLYRSEKRAHVRLARAQKQLIESEKMAALGKLSAAIAHEINNPLGIINNYLLILGQDLDGNSHTIEKIDIIREEVERISLTIRQLLDFYRPHKDEYEEVDIAKMISDVIEVIRAPYIKAGIQITYEDSGDSGKVFGSFQQIRQVLINLLSNAKEAMPEGGLIELKSYSENQRFCLSVSDRGAGIPEEHMSKIFEPFFTTKENQNGTGLGLSVSYGIIKRHGGIIKALNNEDQGATFIVSLPIKEYTSRA